MLFDIQYLSMTVFLNGSVLSNITNTYVQFPHRYEPREKIAPPSQIIFTTTNIKVYTLVVAQRYVTYIQHRVQIYKSHNFNSSLSEGGNLSTMPYI